jgi:hypothetical protein
MYPVSSRSPEAKEPDLEIQDHSNVDHQQTSPPQQSSVPAPYSQDAEPHQPDLAGQGYSDLERGQPETKPSQSHDQPLELPSSLRGEYNPMGILQRRNQPGQANYPLEQKAPDIPRAQQTHELPSGPFSSRIFRGNAPFIQSKKEDYDNQHVGVDYDNIISHLAPSDPRRQEDMAHDMLLMAKDDDEEPAPDLSKYSEQEKRAMTHLLGITQVAEEHPNRTTGSAALARASIRNVADGTSTFHEEFNSKNGSYVPARRKIGKEPGGTQQMKDFVSGKRMYEESELTAANMSEDEDRVIKKPRKESSERDQE